MPFNGDSHHDGMLDTSYSGMSLSNDNVVARSIKFVDKFEGYIIRLVETSGRSTEAEIRFEPAKSTFRTVVESHEVKTLFISPNGKVVKETDLTEQMIN